MEEEVIQSEWAGWEDSEAAGEVYWSCSAGLCSYAVEMEGTWEVEEEIPSGHHLTDIFLVDTLEDLSRIA